MRGDVAACAATLCLATVSCAPALVAQPELAAIGVLDLAASAEAARISAERATRLLDAAPPSARLLEAEALALEAVSKDRESAEGWVALARSRALIAAPSAADDEALERSRRAVETAQLCGRHAPAEAACDYWLAVAVGIRAREQRSTALDGVRRMVDLLSEVIARDPGLDRAGPHRVLALVLVRAPGWPAGPGDPDLAVEHAREALRIAPDYPPNLLALGEAAWAVDDVELARRTFNEALAVSRRLAAAGNAETDGWIEQARTGLDRAGGIPD